MKVFFAHYLLKNKDVIRETRCIVVAESLEKANGLALQKNEDTKAEHWEFMEIPIVEEGIYNIFVRMS